MINCFLINMPNNTNKIKIPTQNLVSFTAHLKYDCGSKLLPSLSMLKPIVLVSHFLKDRNRNIADINISHIHHGPNNPFFLSNINILKI